MHNRPTLTVAIPTYNRVSCLEVLLRNLGAQLAEVRATDIEILISDNCSADETANVATDFCSNYPNVKILRNDENRGADYNIAQCFIEASGHFVWILGDDDLVQPGALAGILDVLREDTPDLTFLTAIGIDGDLSTLNLTPVALPIARRTSTRIGFANHVNIHLTFISGIIIRKDSYRKPTSAIFARLGTSLIQLEWNINALLTGEKFCIVTTPVVYARSNQSGGYKLFDVFVTNFIALVKSMCRDDQQVARALIVNALWGHLPALIYGYRFATVGNFERQSIMPILYRSTKSYLAFWTSLAPISVLPKPFAYVFYGLARIRYKLMRVMETN